MELLELILTLVILVWGLQIMLFAVGLSKTPPSRALGWMLGWLITGTFRLLTLSIRGSGTILTTTFRQLELAWVSRIGRSHNMSELRLSVPSDQKISVASAEQFLTSLPRSFGLVVYEIIGTAQQIVVQFACRARHSSELQSLLEAYFPNCVVTKGATLAPSWESAEKAKKAIAEYGLSAEFQLPVRTFSSFDVDPLIPVIGALEHLRADETGVFQVLFRQARHRRIRSLMHAGRHQDDTTYPSTARRQKVSRPIYAAIVRVAARAPSKERARQITTLLGAALQQYADPTRNSFVPRSTIGYTTTARERDLIERSASRGGTLLNSQELAALVHPPSSSVRSHKLARKTKRTKAPPEIVL